MKIGQTIQEEFFVLSVNTEADRNHRHILLLELINRELKVFARFKYWKYHEQSTEKQIQKGDLVRIKGVLLVEGKTKKIEAFQLEKMEKEKASHSLSSLKSSLDTLKSKLDYYIQSIENPILAVLCATLWKDPIISRKLLLNPAHPSHHHAYIGGLLEHTVSMMGFAKKVHEHYPFLSLDLLLAGCMWHDIGKVAEYDLLDDVPLDVKLAGHISFGVILLERACAKLNIDPRQEEVILLRHMILSHHDRKELGSPLCPQIPEAWALHMIDTSDSFFQMIYQQLRDVSQGEWGNPKDGLSSIFYHHSFLNLAEQNYFS